MIMELIEKDALLAEIERKRDICKKVVWDLRSQENKDYYQGKAEAYRDALSLINTLEVKEVDLERELDSMITPELKFHKALPSLFDVAKHFFELGLSSQLSWKEIELIAKIGMDFMNSEDSDNLNDEEYYTEILNRFKAQKGEEV